MKEKLQCDNCGGNLIKDGEVFVCQSCGPGYKFSEEKTEYRNPQLDNTIIDNGLDTNKVQNLAREFREFCYDRGDRGVWYR